eukprot:8171490-Ditylum_brightwellii.AAC.1
MLKRIPTLTNHKKHILIEGSNCWSWNIGANDDTTVAQALKKVASNPLFKSTLEQLLGRNPAMLEICTITAGHGAKGQYFHSNTVHSANSLVH